MRTFSQFFEDQKNNKINVSDDTLSYISAADLKKFLKIANDYSFSKEAIAVINWLIVNNTTYYSTLAPDTDKNVLAEFYNNGRPKKEDLAALWDNVKAVVDSGRLKEIPLFLTQKEFDDVIEGKVKPDMVILDFKTEQGRNKIAKMYTPLVIKMAKSWLGKSNMDFEEIQSAAYEGLVKAMNTYGKNIKKDENGEDLSKLSFLQYAAYIIRWTILDDVKNVSQTVRVSISQQNKERKEKGSNTKNNTISGDKTVGHDTEGEGKTLFDYMGISNDVENAMNREDINKLWNEVYACLEKKFKKKVIDIFFSFYGLGEYEKLQNKELAKKYDVGPSDITYYTRRVVDFLIKDKEIRKITRELYDLYHECKNEEDMSNDNEPIHINDNKHIHISYIDEINS